MKDKTIEYKVKVFISSLCGGRYNLVRKALKLLLLETNLTIVYVFETTGSSSQDVISSYSNKLDDSDVCIFLIDNKDGISEAVVREQKRSRKLGIKSIYLFCDEDQKEPTLIQKEITISVREKFCVVHEFTDFINIGYESILQDIIDIYRTYCKGSLINKRNDENEEDLKRLSIDSYIIDEHLFKGIDLTKNALLKIVYPFDRETKKTSVFDELCKNLLNIIIGKDSIESFNFNTLEIELCNLHKESIINFIKIRIKAIKAYFEDNIVECLIFMNLAYEEAISNASIPNWLSNDVLIDMRNMQNLLDESKNKHTIQGKAQLLLNKSKESIYFPAIDRFDSGFRKDVLNKCLNSNTESPYTTSFGGLETIFEKISSAFAISVLYGSLTQILMLRERIIDALSNLCFFYNDHSIYLELIKELVMSGKDKEIKELSRAYNQTTDMINSDDIKVISIAINSIPINHKKIISKLILFEHFGYYISNEQYITISNELLNEINLWIHDSNRIFAMSTYIFKALITNTRRLDNNKISDVIINLFKQSLKRWYDDALKVVKTLDFSTLTKETEEALADLLLKIVLDEENINYCHYLPETIIYVRKNISIKTDDIDECVKVHMEKFFNETYSLEVFSYEEKDSLKHINRFLQEIHTQNEKQGENGIYFGWGGNPYQTIKNIITFNKLDLNWKSIVPIILAINETLTSKKQTISAKVDAVQLLMFLNNNTTCKNECHETFDKLIEMQSDILCGHEDDFFCKDTLSTLEFNFLMLKVCFAEQNINDLISYFSLFTQKNNYEIIKSVECIEVLLNNIDFNLLDTITLTILIQYVIGMSSHKETDVRYYSVLILFRLCQSSCRVAAMMQLSKMMDNDNYIIKANILNGIDILWKENTEIAELVKQKGQADNHFLIRELAIKKTS
ncbi:MAG TPA: hypothetical protein VIK72_02600 [Clostridiaceae bacterium]